MPPDYRTVFDLATVGFKSWRLAATGLIGIGAALALLWTSIYRPALLRGGPSRSSTPFACVALGFTVLWTAATFTATWGQYRALRTAVERHETSVAEGLVTDFRPMPVTGHSMERFCVSGHCFEYSDFIVVAGFNNTTSHGGPIRAGLPVRVTYVGNSIVKLEVAR